MAKKKDEKNKQKNATEINKSAAEIKPKTDAKAKISAKSTVEKTAKSKKSTPNAEAAPKPSASVKSKTDAKTKKAPAKVEVSKPDVKKTAPTPNAKSTRTAPSKQLAKPEQKPSTVAAPIKTKTKEQTSSVSKKQTKKPVQEIKPEQKSEAVQPAKKQVALKQKEMPIKKTTAPKISETLKKSAQSQETLITEAEETTTQAPPVRYSDEELEMFEKVIMEAKRESFEELRMLKERLEDLNTYDLAEESMFYSMHMGEQGSEPMEKEKTYAQIQRINEYIKKLDEALQRIKDKTYGICRACGILIAKERLLAVPITTLSASWKIHQRCPEDGIDRIEPFVN